MANPANPFPRELPEQAWAEFCDDFKCTEGSALDAADFAPDVCARAGRNRPGDLTAAAFALSQCFEK